MNPIARIISRGSYVPSEEHPNSELRARFGDEIISKSEEATGILTRFYAPADWAASDLAVQAIEAALSDAQLAPGDIDLLVLGTDTPDYLTPATSVVVQQKANLKRAGTFDVGCACASFPTGLAIASGIIATQPNVKRALVVGVYLMHKLADLEKDPMSFYYGDGAGAVVLEAGTESGFISSTFAADGSFHANWGIFAGGTAEPATVEAVQAGRTQVRFVSPFPSTVNREGWPQRVREVAKNGGFKLSDIDHIIFTQVRSKTISQVMEDLGLPEEKAHKTMHKFGYTGSACLPIAFDDAWKLGKIKPGNLVVFVGSGVGYNQCAVAFRV